MKIIPVLFYASISSCSFVDRFFLSGHLAIWPALVIRLRTLNCFRNPEACTVLLLAHRSIVDVLFHPNPPALSEFADRIDLHLSVNGVSANSFLATKMKTNQYGRYTSIEQEVNLPRSHISHLLEQDRHSCDVLIKVFDDGTKYGEHLSY